MPYEQQILRTQRYLRKLEGTANRAIRRYLRGVRRDNEVPDLTDLVPVIKDLMILGFAHGYTARAMQFEPIKLAFASPFEKAVAGVLRLFTTEGLEHLLSDFGMQAYLELSTANVSVQPYVSQLLQAVTTKEVRQASAQIAGIAEARVKTIARTMSHQAYSAAHYTADQQPAVQEILWGYKYLTAGDERVRPEHVAMDGVTAPKDDPIWDIWWPPNGWNCRCIIVSIFEKQTEVEPAKIEGGAPVPDTGFSGNPSHIL